MQLTNEQLRAMARFHSDIAAAYAKFASSNSAASKARSSAKTYAALAQEELLRAAGGPRMNNIAEVLGAIAFAILLLYAAPDIAAWMQGALPVPVPVFAGVR